MKCSVYKMSCLWNVLSKKCPFYEMYCLGNVLSMKCPVYKMSSLRNVLSIKCPVFKMSWLKLFCLYNVLSIKCPVYKMSCQWNVLSIKCPVYEMFYQTSCLRNVLSMVSQNRFSLFTLTSTSFSAGIAQNIEYIHQQPMTTWKFMSFHIFSTICKSTILRN